MSDECLETPGQKEHSYKAEQVVFLQLGISPLPVVLTEHLCTASTGMCLSAMQIPPPLLLLCPVAWLPSARAMEAVHSEFSELAHASKL